MSNAEETPSTYLSTTVNTRVVALYGIHDLQQAQSSGYSSREATMGNRKTKAMILG